MSVCMSVCTEWDDIKNLTVSRSQHIACNALYARIRVHARTKRILAVELIQRERCALASSKSYIIGCVNLAHDRKELRGEIH